jgi:hypothetical protein
MWIGFIWIRIGTDDVLLWTRQWTFGFHKMRGISWLAVQEWAATQFGTILCIRVYNSCNVMGFQCAAGLDSHALQCIDSEADSSNIYANCIPSGPRASGRVSLASSGSD